MDFSSLDTRKKANDGAFLHLKHPGTGVKMHDGCNPLTGAGGDQSKPVGLTMLGKDSDRHAAWSHGRANSILLAKDDSKKTSEEGQTETVAMLANLVTSWSHLSIGSDKNQHTTENSVELFTVWKWSAEQALEFFLDRSNFI